MKTVKLTEGKIRGCMKHHDTEEWVIKSPPRGPPAPMSQSIEKTGGINYKMMREESSGKFMISKYRGDVWVGGFQCTVSGNDPEFVKKTAKKFLKALNEL